MTHRALLTVAAAVAVATATGSLLAHDPIRTKVSWEREIGPIVHARCVSCHSPGGPAPMSLATYADTRPWARAIREEVLARRMPKWPVVRGYGDFANDPSLSPFEIALVTAWVDGGAPERIVRPGQRQPPRSAPRPPEVIAPPDPGDVRTETLACRSASLPAGTLLGLTPQADEGASLEVVVHDANGLAEPILWLREFDPAFANTYWLRTPIVVAKGARISISATPSGPCRLALHFTR